MTATQDVEYTYHLTLPQILREGMDRHGHRAYVALGAAISAAHGLSPTMPCRVRVTYGDAFGVEVQGSKALRSPSHQVLTAAVIGAWASCAVWLAEQLTVVDLKSRRVPDA